MNAKCHICEREVPYSLIGVHLDTAHDGREEPHDTEETA